MSTYVKEKNNKYRIYTKGGAENIKNYCKFYIDSNTGEKKVLDEKILKDLKTKIESYNNSMLRTLYTCYKDIEENDFNNINDEDDINNLILLGIFGIRDTIRKGVKEAVEKCKAASVNIIMVTGDNIETTCAIAKECNIIESNLEINIQTESNIISQENNSFICLKKDFDKRIYKKILLNPPREINGDLFYEIIGGLKCFTCKKKVMNVNAQKQKQNLKKIKNDRKT